MTSQAAELEINQNDAIQGMLKPTFNNTIRFGFTAIAYNGKSWLAGSSDITREKRLLTYPEVMTLLNAYYDYTAYITVLNGQASYLEYLRDRSGNSNLHKSDIQYLRGKIVSMEKLKQGALSQVIETYKFLRETRKVRVGQSIGPVVQPNGTILIQEIGGTLVPGGLEQFSLYTVHTLAKSTDGISWTLIEANPFQPEVRATTLNPSLSEPASVNGIAWNSQLSLWVAVGGRPLAMWNKSQYGGSFSRSNTSTQITTSEYSGFLNGQYVYTDLDGNYRFTTGSINNTVIATSPDGETWTQYAIQGDDLAQPVIANGVATSSNLTVVVGKNFKRAVSSSNIAATIATSSDCKLWTSAKAEQLLTGTTYVGLTDGRGVAYNGNLWVAVGKGTTGNLYSTSLYTSSNGTTWTARSLPSIENIGQSGFELNAVAWNGSTWLTVGTDGHVYKSEDGGVSWVGVSKSFFDNNTDFYSVAWDGNFWFIGGSGIFRSKDTIVWEKLESYGGRKSIATAIPLPILGGSIQETNSIIVGQGSPASVLRSSDNLKWYSQVFDILQTNYSGNPQKEYFDAVWTGNYWIVVGDPGRGMFDNNIARSANGVDWTFPTNELVRCRGVAWNGSKLVVVGDRQVNVNKISAMSTDEGATWTTGDLNNYLGTVSCVATDGTLWVAGGYRGIATSSNGLNWSLVNLCPLDEVNSIAWNGYIWVATGKGKSHTIALSTNGTYWYIANPETNIFTRGNAVAWNRSQWIMVGEGSTHTMARSVDGYTWTGMGNSTFGIAGKTISWAGSYWIATGLGEYPFATSTDGLVWTRYELPISRCNKFATKTVTLPYTGTTNQSVLTTVNAGTAIVTTSTNSTIAAEEAAAKLAADQAAAAAAAAAEAATRLSSKNSAALYRIKFLYWKKRITDQFDQIKSNTYLDAKNEHPVEYLLAESIFDKLTVYTTEGQYYYEKASSASSPLDIVAANLQRLEAFDSTLSSDLLQFYNNARFLFKKIVDARYAALITNSNLESIITNYGYSQNDETAVLGDYNSAKSAIDAARTTSNAVFDTEVTSISYTNGISPTLLYDKAITDTLTINNVTSTIYSLITTNAPNLYQSYTNVDFGSMQFLYATFTDNNVYKQQADTLVSNTLSIAGNWAAVTGGSVPTQEINDAFAALYNKYFYISEIPYRLEVWTQQGFINALPLSIKYFKIIADDYRHPSQYDTELATLYTELKDKLDSLETTRITAINYSRNLRNTTVKNKLTEFQTTTKTEYTASLGIDQHIQDLCNLTYYSNSSFVRAKNFANIVDVASKVYPQLYPLIRAVKFADAEAEDDGCIPPSTGWGSSLNNLPAGQKGKQGLSGWNKFNETYYARQRLTDHIRANNVNGFVAYIINNQAVGGTVLWRDFLNFTETFTYTMLQESIDDLTQTVNTLNDNAAFDEATIDGIASTDIDDIQDEVIPAATAYLSGLLTSTTENLPSENDSTAFGNVSINGSATLSSMVSSINTAYDDLTAAATESLVGKTNNEIQTIVENAIEFKDTIDNIQKSTAYLTILEGIETYKTNFARATNHIELMEEQIARWTRMKASAIANTPYLSTGLGDGNGNPFISGIAPNDSTYWTQRTYTSFFNPDTRLYQECTFNQQTNKIVTLPALDPAKFIAYSSTTTYKKFDMVSYNNKVYECTRDVSSEYLENALLNLGKYDDPSALFIQGVLPTDTARWKRRRYPYVTFNGVQIEADPANIKALEIDDYLPYTPTYEYVQGSIVRSGDKIYICKDDVLTTGRIKGILPTNDNYWKEVAYQTVIYNNQEVEASPTNLPALSLSNFDAYSADKIYYVGNFVKENSKIYELVEYTTSDSLGKNVLSSLGSAPSLNENSRWVERTYPVVFLNGVKIEATPGTFSALNINNYSAYSDSVYYVVGNTVKYNNKIYVCTLKVRSSLINVPVSNTEYWMQITFPTVFYNEKLTELIPGAIPPLDPAAYAATSSYRTAKRYFAGDIVEYSGALYECISNIPYGLGVRNILPTITSYWKERKYPYVVVNGVEVEADPDSGVFVELNHLDFHRYEPRLLYYIGDVVAYNGDVYECTNVTPPLLEDPSITNIVPTNSSYWTLLDFTLETTYEIVHWFPTVSYETGTVVNFNGKIYNCETRSLNNRPSELGIYWSEITDYSKLRKPVPPLYSGSTEYGIGSLISYRQTATGLPNNETHKLKFYFCSSTEQNRPVRYTYDTMLVSDEKDENDDYLYQIQPGNWLTITPKYGLAEDDPFKLPMFAYKLRRRVALEIELPYEGLKYNTFTFDGRFKGYFKDLLVTQVTVKPSNATTAYNALEARGDAVCTAFDTLESSPNMSIYKLISKAYKQVNDYLVLTLRKIDQYIKKINVMKTQYFNNPGVQKRIYDNPYKFMNPIAFAKNPPQKAFADLGVGNIREMESEVYSGNQLNYTMEDIRVYYASTNIIDTIQEEIGKLLIQAKCLTGFNVLFKAKQSQTKMGVRFPCLIEGWDDTYLNQNMVYQAGYGPYVNIDIPITDYDIFIRWSDSRQKTGTVEVPYPDTIIDLINRLMSSSVTPPEYTIGTSPLLESLTWESQNPGIRGLSSVAKGLVGLAAATFKNFVDPWQIVGAIDFVGQVVTNDYSKKILTFIPEGKWPTFNERAGDIRAFKQLVNIEKANIANAKDEFDEQALIGFLETVGKLLRMNQYDIDDLNALDTADDIVVDKRTVTEIIPIPEPPTRPPDYTPPKQPEAPELKTTQCRANLIAEREQLRAMQRNLEKRLAALQGGRPKPSKYYVPIPEAVYQEVKAVTADKPSKWVIKDMDAAGAALRGTNTVKVSKSNTWNGAALPTADVQRGPTDIPVNQAVIDSAVERRKVSRAEFKQALEEFRLKQAQRQIIIAQIEDARLREVQMTTAIDEVEFKNALIEAENDALTADYKKQLTEHQEYLENLREKKALAEERYQKALQEYETKLKKFPQNTSELINDLNTKKLALTQVVNDIVDGEEVLVVRRTTYEARLVTRPPVKTLLSRMLPANLLAQYDDIVNSATQLVDETAKRVRRVINQAVAPAASAAREAMAFLDNRPKLKPFAKFIRIIDGGLTAAKPRLIGALGPLMEIAGIGLQAWQDGAFEEGERLS